MNIYKVEISAYPVEFTVSAENEEEALKKASQEWYDQNTDMGGIYESKVMLEATI